MTFFFSTSTNYLPAVQRVSLENLNTSLKVAGAICCYNNVRIHGIVMRSFHRFAPELKYGTPIQEYLVSIFAFVHQPLSEIVETLSFRFRAISQRVVFVSFRTFEPLLAGEQVCFHSTAGEKSALHFLGGGDVSWRRRRAHSGGRGGSRLCMLSR